MVHALNSTWLAPSFVNWTHVCQFLLQKILVRIHIETPQAPSFLTEKFKGHIETPWLGCTVFIGNVYYLFVDWGDVEARVCICSLAVLSFHLGIWGYMILQPVNSRKNMFSDSVLRKYWNSCFKNCTLKFRIVMENLTNVDIWKRDLICSFLM